MGHGNQHCIATLVERATGSVLIGKLRSRRADGLTRRTIALIRQSPRKFQTITADHGTEFHSYREIERATDVRLYFAAPYHSWERGTHENTNGLIRQYLPNRKSMAGTGILGLPAAVLLGTEGSRGTVAHAGHRTKKLGRGSASEYGSYVKPHRRAHDGHPVPSRRRGRGRGHRRNQHGDRGRTSP